MTLPTPLIDTLKLAARAAGELLREGYHIETAANVEEAWQQLQEHSYSALITDMRLPDGTGLDLLHRLEAAGRTEKAIVITAYGSAENAVSALKAGAYDYLTKPVDIQRLKILLDKIVERLETLREVKTLRRQLRDQGSFGTMIGNSPKSDINPSLAAGLRAVLVPHERTWTLEREEIRDPHGRLLIADGFTDLLFEGGGLALGLGRG